MGKWKYTDLKDLDDVFKKASVEFVKGEKELLANLRKVLNGLLDRIQDPKSKKKLEEIIRSVQQMENGDRSAPNSQVWEIGGLFKENLSSWQLHTELWSHSSRTHASKIVQANDGPLPSAFTIIEAKLKNMMPSRYSGDQHLRRVREEILLTRQQHQQLRKIQKRRLLYAAKNATADKLIELLNLYVDTIERQNVGKAVKEFLYNETKKLIPRVKAIKNLKSRDEAKGIDGSNLDTSKQCLQQHREVGDILATVIKHHPRVREDDSEDILHYANQLELMTKRWIDPHFKNPVEQTAMDTARRGMKLSSMTFAAVVSITAIILLFTPLAPLSPFVAAIGAVGLWPLIDTAINVIHNAIAYRRGPMRAQSYELGIGVPLVSALVVSAHLPAIGQGLASAVSQSNNGPATVVRAVSQGLTSPAAQAVSQAMGSYGINGFAGGLNSFMVAFFARIFKRQSHDANNTKQLKTHETVSQQSAYRILTVGDKPEQIANTMWLKPNKKSESYMWKATDGKIHKRGSLNAAIRGVGFFRIGVSSGNLKLVQQSHRSYCELPSDTSLSDRVEQLQIMQRNIESWQHYHGLNNNYERYHDATNKHPTSRMTPVLKELGDFVNKEVRILNKVKDNQKKDATGRYVNLTTPTNFVADLQDRPASLILVQP